MTDADVDPDLVVNRDWLRRWVPRTPRRHARHRRPTDGRCPFAIMDYGHPGRSRASANIGDHVQSLASLGHLARHQKLSYTGPQDLVDLPDQLQRPGARPRRQRRRRRGRRRAAHRSTGTPRRTPRSRRTPGPWRSAGSCTPIFDMRYGFPFHPNLLPIFVSFHCSKRDLLTDEAIDYLRRFAPDRLPRLDHRRRPALGRRAGVLLRLPDHHGQHRVPRHPPSDRRPDAQVAYVDVPADHGARRRADATPTATTRSASAASPPTCTTPSTCWRPTAASTPGWSPAGCTATCPARSLGVPVDFQPKNRSDPRFAGLIDITDAEFRRDPGHASARSSSTVLTAAFSGDSPDAVYALWREINAADVDAARRRHAVPARTAVGPQSTCATEADRIADTRPSDPDTVHVVVHAPAGRQTRASSR